MSNTGIRLTSEQYRKARAVKPPCEQGYSITVRLPPPPSECSPNSRCHWAAKARAAKAQREIAMLSVIRELNGFTRPRIDVTLYARVNRRRDRDNLIASLKSAVDGLVDAGLFDDDHAVEWGRVEFAKDKVPSVVLTISET